MADINKFIDEISNMTVLELNELVKALEEKFGVSAAAPVAVAAAPAAGAAAAAPAAEEKTEFNVVLKDVGAKKIDVIKVVRAFTGLGLVEAKAAVEKGGVLKENVAKEEAEKIVADLKAAGGRKRVLYSQLLFLHLNFGCRAYVYHGYAARKFGKAFLKFFFVVVGSGFGNLRLNRGNARLDGLLVAHTVDDGGVVFVNFNLSCPAEHIGGHVLELVAEVGRNDRAAREDCYIFEHCLSSVL